MILNIFLNKYKNISTNLIINLFKFRNYRFKFCPFEFLNSAIKIHLNLQSKCQCYIQGTGICSCRWVFNLLCAVTGARAVTICREASEGFSSIFHFAARLSLRCYKKKKENAYNRPAQIHLTRTSFNNWAKT